jgi:hypothetical protein
MSGASVPPRHDQSQGKRLDQRPDRRQDQQPDQDLARYLAASTGLPLSTAARIIADVNAYYDETVEDFVRRRHAELKRKNRKNDEIWPEIAAELHRRRFVAADLSERQLRRLIYG